jgi:hypothetical protein
MAKESGVTAERKNGTEEKATAQVAFSLPSEYKDKLEGEAERLGKTSAALVRQLVADHFSWELPESTRGRKANFATPEEKAAAQKKAQAERNALTRALLARFRKGEITLTPEELAVGA